jgi:ketosteroid isomerase-like protein
MNWIFEGPWPILLTGAILEAILLIALVRTGRAVLLWAILGAGLLTGGLLIAERAIVTDNERIAGTLDGIARAAEANDLDGILAYVAPDAAAVRRMAADGLRQVTVREAHVGDLEIKINDKTSPPAALATFIGRFRVTGRRGESLGHDTFVGRFQAGLVKQNDQWLVVSLDHRDVSHGEQ